MKVIYIESTDRGDIVSELLGLGIKGSHITNGTYSYSAKLIVPTTLAGFKRVSQSQASLPMIIAVNSDRSMKLIGQNDKEKQEVRAAKVAEPLASAFPDNQVIIIYYDEETPAKLYAALAKHGITRTLHKWGYGTSEDAPAIVGAEHFEMVFGFPLPNDKKPVCYDQTPKADSPQKISVVDLRDELISEKGVLFELPEDLAEYVDPAIKAPLEKGLRI